MSENNFTKIGFDYGVKPFYLLLGDIEFVDLFTEADCRGVAYLFKAGNSQAEMIPVQMLFIFNNEKPAEKFMANLLQWISKSNNDGDAVDIEFIEDKQSGYTIAISQEITRFHKRMLPKSLQNRVSPLSMNATTFKKITKLGENFLNFKANYSQADGIKIGYVIGDEKAIRKKGEKYFTKKEFKFSTDDKRSVDPFTDYDYDDPESKAKFNASNLPKPPKQSREEIELRRVSEMKSLLPLTYNKLGNKWLGDLQEKLSKTYDLELVKQAVCNLTIFERLQQMENLPTDFTKEGYANRIQDYLHDTYESFDSYYPEDKFYTEELIINQVKNDQKELENYLNK